MTENNTESVNDDGSAFPQKDDDEDADDCQLCCEVLTKADRMYPLLCPTPECSFNFCRSCISKMETAEKDDYQQASDGSNQVKTHVQCPICRSKYRCKKYSSSVIVDTVLLLRLAKKLEAALIHASNDSELSASILGQKEEFLKSRNLETLQTAEERLRTYYEEIDKQAMYPAGSLNYTIWNQAFRNKDNLLATSYNKGGGGSSNQGEHSSNNNGNRIRLDPTLLQGLEDFMSRDEQIFVSKLFLAGEARQLQQGALILHGIFEQMVCGALQPTGAASDSEGKPPLDLHILRRRFPLPPHMPRCVSWPAYDPNQPGKQKNALQLKTKSKDKEARNINDSDELTVASIRGLAGQKGLRKGDVVTHCQGERVTSVEQLYATLSAAYAQNSGTVMIEFNCNEHTAKALQERALKMQKAGIVGLQ